KPSVERISAVEGDATALVSAVGARLLAFAAGAVETIERTPTDAPPPMSAGLTLAPWPNRIRHGRWSARGHDHRLLITDRRFGAAIHGLVRDVEFETTRLGDAAVRFVTRIGPAVGWPFHLALAVEYRVDRRGLTVTARARNLGDGQAPFALGAHPFFRVGEAPVTDLVLTGPAASMLVDDGTGIPVDRAPVSPMVDVRRGVRVSELERSRCYTDVAVREGAVSRCIEAPSGDAVEIWGDPQFAYWQIFAPRDFPGPDGPTLALAVEPMTAPADAFNSGWGVAWLEPGAGWSARWGVRVVRRGRPVVSA